MASPILLIDRPQFVGELGDVVDVRSRVTHAGLNPSNRQTTNSRYRIDLNSEPSVSAAKRRHRFDVIGLREHVQGLDFVEGVAAVDQDAQVAGKS